MGNPSSATPEVPPKTQDSRKSGKFKVSQQPILSPHLSNGENGHTHAHNEPAHPKHVSSSHPPASSAAGYEEHFGALPDSYNHNSLFLTARDPHWLFSYWDFKGDHIPAQHRREGRKAFYRKVYRICGEVETLVEINPSAKNWYVAVRHGGTIYHAELGYFDTQDNWQCLLRSGNAQTPPDALASEDNQRFATVQQALSFEELQALVHQHMLEGETLLEAVTRITSEGQVRIQASQPPAWTNEQRRLLAMLLGESLVNAASLGSAEIDQLLRRSLQQRLHSEAASGLSGAWGGLLAPGEASLFSPFGASFGAQRAGAKEENFFMHLNAEIIFYGGTAPDANLRINGQPVQLQPDGTFRFHFTLPDGSFEIPVVASSRDTSEQRSAQLSFRRQTETAGHVEVTPQPVHLEPLIGRCLS